MLLRRFYINLILRLLLILLNMLAIAFLARDLIGGQFLFTFIVLCGILVFQAGMLLLYIRRTNRMLTRLVLSMSNQDFTKLPDSGQGPHGELRQALNRIVEQYRSVYMEKESQAFLIQHLIQAIPAGILVLGQEGEIILLNPAFEQILDLKGIKQVQGLEKKYPELMQWLLEDKGDDQTVLETSVSGEHRRLSVMIRRITLLNRQMQICLVQDISREVEAGELEAIRRLLRILTHEIMNSLAPLQSLTETIAMLMTDQEGRPRSQDDLSQESYDDILDSVLAIQERTGGLDHFVNQFRTLNRIPENLQRSELKVITLFDAVGRIMKSELEGMEVKRFVEPESLSIQADRALMEQVLINLMANAIAAVSCVDAPRLELRASVSRAGVKLLVVDNGAGIPEDRLADIFLPFYSTKEEGSGIGLSFVKQVLLLHHASITVQSTPGSGSTFSIQFPSSFH